MNTKTKAQALLLTILTIISSPAIGQYADSWQDVLTNKSGKLSIIYYESPGIMRVQNGRATGLCADILAGFQQFVKDKYSVDLTIQLVSGEIDFDTFLKRIESSQNILGVGEITITEERKKVLRFTPPYVAMPNVLITNKAAAPLQNLTNLSGWQAIALQSAAQAYEVERLQKKYSPQNKTLYFGNVNEIINKVSQLPRSYTVLSLSIFMDSNRKSMNVKMEKLDMGAGEMIAMAMSKKSDWDKVWDEYLSDSYLRSEVHKKLIAKNLGAIFLKSFN